MKSKPLLAVAGGYKSCDPHEATHLQLLLPDAATSCGNAKLVAAFQSGSWLAAIQHNETTI